MSDTPYTRKYLKRDGEQPAEPRALLTLATFHNDKMVGHAQIYKSHDSQRKGIGDLAIYLHQDFHNTRLGTAMLSKLFELAKMRGCIG